MEADCKTWLEPLWSSIAWKAVLSFSMPVTVLICASWEVSCAFSIGFNGSWLFSCVTSSLRKRCSLSLPDPADGVEAARAPAAPDELIESMAITIFS